MSNEPDIAGDQLRSIVERIERMDAEIADLNADKKEIYAEAKGTGYDVKVLRKVVALRRRDLDERKEEEAILDLYLSAVGEVRDDSKPRGSVKQVSEEGGEALYQAAVKLVLADKKASTSHLQRRLQIGYNRAESLMERMESDGIVTARDEAGKRNIAGRAPLDGVTVTVAGTGTRFEKAVTKAAEDAGYKVETAAPKPLVSSFTPGRENPFSDDD